MTKSADDIREIRIILRPLPDGRPWSVRLRHALKTLLRRDRLQCVRIEELPGEAVSLPHDKVRKTVRL